MSIQPPQGILNIPNATLRVGKLAVDSTAGFDTVFNNVERNTILLVDSAEYTENKQWDLKMPNIFVATFEIRGAGSSFNFRNTSIGDAGVGYTLTFNETTLTLKYDNSQLGVTATIPNLNSTYGKVYLTYEKQYFTVTVDGTRVLSYKDTVTRNPPDGEYINFFAGGDGGFKNLKVVAGHLISDGTSNVSLYGGLAVTSNLEVGSSNLFVDTVNSRVGVGTDTPKESLDVVGNMHLTRVSNVSQIKVDSNVVTEYTGPHDRPLRKYPEVYLTGATTGGYTASQSSEYDASGSYNAWKAFDSNEAPSGTLAITQTSQYNNTSGTLIYTGDKDLLGDSNYKGEWIKLELPIAIAVEKIHLQPRSTFFDQTPNNFKIVGSNDDSSWDVLYHNNPAANTIIPSDTEQVHHMTHNLTKYYKYVALVANTTGAPISGNYVTMSLANLELYGHEEGSGSLDTTLKSVYNVPATTGTQLEVYYDAKDLADGAVSSDVTDLSPNSNDGSPTDVSVSDGAFVFNGTSSLMEKTSLSIPGSDNPFTISFWLKNDDFDSNQYILRLGINQTIYQTVAIYKNSSNQIIFASWTLDFPIDYTFTTNQWNHISLVYPGGGWKQSNLIAYIDGRPYTFGGNVSSGGVGGTVLSLATSLTLRLGGFAAGNTHLDGSIANFRLYSKVLNADQVKELYDYQKDYFLGSKSQVTLYKGHLGVGVTEPSGQLELAGDERIQQYPPRGLTNFDTHIEGHGVFTASASSVFSTDEHRQAYQAFNGGTDIVNDDAWISKNDRYTSGLPNANAALINGVAGEWLGIQFPYPIKVKQIAIQNRAGAYNNRSPDSGILWGSNDGTEYEQVVSWSGLSFVTNGSTPSYVTINATNTYRFFRLQGTKVVDTNTSDFLAIGELKFFGTPGPTTLDKGSLTLGRSLDVPRVSRYDVDTETPRPEKLVVDFDTTVNSSPTDISGKGNHGAFYGTNMNYSSADKAFVFNGTDDYIRTAPLGFSGDQVHSVSLWFWSDVEQSTFGSNEHALYGTGGLSSTPAETGISLFGTYAIVWRAGGGTQYPMTFNANQWNHLCMAYSSGGSVNSRLWLNGVELAQNSSATSTSTYSFQTGEYLILGTWIDNATVNTAYTWDGKISNFKLYDTVLEPSEVQKLYRLGRTGRSMVISDTAIGIGKVPEAQLDVRGTARFADVHVGGDIYATGNITGYSDRRAKSDIEKIENALDKIEQLNGYTFTMKGKRYTGLIAQEILPILPEAVTGSEETNYAVAYGNMMGLIVEAIKELKQKIG
jgi:hypothetical protein